MPNITPQSINSPIKPTWCPGCGDYGIWAALRQALVQLEIPEENLVIVYGVGCSGNMADFNRVYGFHSLHGRAIPNAIGIKLANHKLKVIVMAGDGDTYGEGPNHLISVARGNHDITVVVHNNQIYGLTTGQASPTSDKNTKGKSTPAGVVETPFNPIATALSNQAGFVARGFAGQISHLKQLIIAAIQHEGFSLVDVFQPCISFNKINTPQFFQQRIYDLAQENHDATNFKQALSKSFETQRLPIGIFYQNTNSLAYHQQLDQIQQKSLVDSWQQTRDISPIISLMK